MCCTNKHISGEACTYQPPHPINCQQISQMSFGMLSLFSPDLTTYIDNEPLVEPFPQWQPKHSMSRSSVPAQIRAPLLIRGTDCALLVFFLRFSIVSIKCLWGTSPAIMWRPATAKEKQLNEQMKEHLHKRERWKWTVWERVSVSLWAAQHPRLTPPPVFLIVHGEGLELKSLELVLTARLTLGPIWCNRFNGAQKHGCHFTAESSGWDRCWHLS